MLPLWIRAYRLIVAGIGVVALWWQWRQHDDPHFWSSFAHQSSLVASVVLLLGALVFARWQNPAWWDALRGATLIAMLLVATANTLLLDGSVNPFDAIESTWASSVLLQLMPIVMLLDLLIVPLGPRTSPWSALLYLVYPLIYLGWFLQNGEQDGWYPYDFIDHRTYANGYAGVAFVCGALLVLAAFASLLIVSYSRLRRVPAIT